MDGCDINGVDDDDLDNDNDDDKRTSAGDHELEERGRKDGSTMQLKIDFPWESTGESTC